MLVLLEASKFVKRDGHPTDFRAKAVALTASGRQMLRKLWRAGQLIRDAMSGSMSPDEADTRVELLRKLTSVLNMRDEPV